MGFARGGGGGGGAGWGVEFFGLGFLDLGSKGLRFGVFRLAEHFLGFESLGLGFRVWGLRFRD